MEIKDGVILYGLKIFMRPSLIAAEEIWADLGQKLVVTSGVEGTHSAGSWHYYGYGVDFRHRYFDASKKLIAVETLKERLGKSFVVVLKPNHVHVQRNMRL